MPLSIFLIHVKLMSSSSIKKKDKPMSNCFDYKFSIEMALPLNNPFVHFICDML
jgi:hypothetical protein